MRTTLISFSVAAALGVAGTSCKKETDDAPVASKPIEAADEAAEKVREADLPSAEAARDELAEANEEIGAARADLREETREAQTELGEAFTKLRGELRELSADSAEYLAARDRVALSVKSGLDMLEQRVTKLEARSGTLTGPAKDEATKDLGRLRAQMAEARAEWGMLSNASAANWEKARDQSLESLQAVYDGVAETWAEIMTE